MPNAALLLILSGLLVPACWSGFAQETPLPSPPPIPRMVSPSIDAPDEPFSYPSQPTDEIGAMYAPSAAEVTPEGTLYTGFGELVFYAGIDRMPLSHRIRTLESGYRPVVSFSLHKDSLLYTSTMFAAPLTPVEGSTDVVNFVRITIHNPGTVTRRAYLTTAWRYSGPQTTTFPTGDNRFRRPIARGRVGDFYQPGEPFNPQSRYRSTGAAWFRDDKAVYFYPIDPAPQLSASFRDYYNRVPPEGQATVTPDTPMAAVEYAVDLAAGATRTFDFKVPLIPPALTDPAFATVSSANYDTSHAAVVSSWQARVARGMQIATPEIKVNDTFQASLVYDLMALNKVGDDYIQTVNQFQYHRFYLRDTADFIRMYDTGGYLDLSSRILAFMAAGQLADGNFLSQPGQYDGWGLTLWTFGEHYRITHDRAFAQQIYPRVRHAVEWLEQAVAADPLHLVPATDLRDNEYISGHLTGYNFLALDGLDAAILLARDLGHAEDRAHFERVRDSLRRAFLERLDVVTAETGGYIPPALDGNMGGSDWGNLLALVPEQQLAPSDPRVAATLRAVHSRYAEGLMTYRQPDQGTYLHHYLTIKNALTELARGEDEEVIREFYAVLLHTSSTNAGWEYSIRPWGDRDFSGNLSPHGWFAAEYRNLLRNMMVREDGPTLHLLSALSPDWIGAGKTIRVDRALTYFGVTSLSLAMPTETRATLTLNNEYAAGHTPEKLVLHLPWFMSVTSIQVDGHLSPFRGSSIELAPTSHRIELTWSRKPLDADTPASYQDAVARYKKEYQERFDAATGEAGLK